MRDRAMEHSNSLGHCEKMAPVQLKETAILTTLIISLMSETAIYILSHLTIP
jgi:hypothetical protein